MVSFSPLISSSLPLTVCEKDLGSWLFWMKLWAARMAVQYLWNHAHLYLSWHTGRVSMPSEHANSAKLYRYQNWENIRWDRYSLKDNRKIRLKITFLGNSSRVYRNTRNENLLDYNLGKFKSAIQEACYSPWGMYCASIDHHFWHVLLHTHTVSTKHSGCRI